MSGESPNLGAIYLCGIGIDLTVCPACGQGKMILRETLAPGFPGRRPERWFSTGPDKDLKKRIPLRNRETFCLVNTISDINIL